MTHSKWPLGICFVYWIMLACLLENMYKWLWVAVSALVVAIQVWLRYLDRDEWEIEDAKNLSQGSGGIRKCVVESHREISWVNVRAKLKKKSEVKDSKHTWGGICGERKVPRTQSFGMCSLFHGWSDNHSQCWKISVILIHFFSKQPVTIYWVSFLCLQCL